jgi:hypothetical protein
MGDCDMSAKNRAGWELQWQPSNGAPTRNLVISWRAARNAMLALGVCGTVLVGGGLLAGRDVFRTHGAVGAARSENEILKTRQDALRERASILLDRLETMNGEGAPLSAISVRHPALAGAKLSAR